MKTLVVYDSAYGNTQKIAEAIGAALAEAEVRHAHDVKAEDLIGLKCLVVGSPTQKMNFTEGIRDFLAQIPANGLAGVNVATFDTRITNDDMRTLTKSPLMRFIVKLFLHRYAAEPLMTALRKKAGKSVIKPEGFFVTDTKGPLKASELERATAWAQQIAQAEQG
ncbi:MAG TPA: flavodoxin family protein [Aggregatilineaceae bacterium]|nr:flavodoxin family protein [Aggregatilineaceae bacterium]